MTRSCQFIFLFHMSSKDKWEFMRISPFPGNVVNLRKIENLMETMSMDELFSLSFWSVPMVTSEAIESRSKR